MFMQTLACAVIRMAVVDAKVDGDYVLALAYDPCLPWQTRYKLLRDHQLYVDAVSFLLGSPDLVTWAHTAGLDAYAVTEKWSHGQTNPT
jgi:hypothetical protein